MPERLGASEAAATARLMWTPGARGPIPSSDELAAALRPRLARRGAGEVAGLLRPVPAAGAAALPFPSGLQAQTES